MRDSKITASILNISETPKVINKNDLNKTEYYNDFEYKKCTINNFKKKKKM